MLPTEGAQFAVGDCEERIKSLIGESLRFNLDFVMSKWRMATNPWKDDDSFNREISFLEHRMVERPHAIKLGFFKRMNILCYYGIAMAMLAVWMIVSMVHKSSVKKGIEEACWHYLRGKVYCRACGTSHQIASVYAEQIWTKGGADDGWVAYVSAQRFKDGSYHDPYGYRLKLKDHKVVSMTYDENISPSYE